MGLSRWISSVALTCLFSLPWSQGLVQAQQDHGSLVINELLAVNGGTAVFNVPDPQGENEDWIELYNRGDTPIDLGGMYLTDDPSTPKRWRIPEATMIDPGSYLLIWADNDEADPGLHASFKLSADGEEVALFDTDGLTLIDSVQFGEQTEDVSYGRSPNATGPWRRLTLVTPGMANIAIYQGFTALPQLSHAEGIFSTALSVEITSETDGATIYYSTDGSDPYNYMGGAPTGTVYTNPIPISEMTQLKATAVKAGFAPSATVSAYYMFLDPDIQAFSSNLPIAVVDTFDRRIGQGAQTSCYAGFIEVSTDDRAHITAPPDFIGFAGINVRGKSSAGWPKHQYHFEAWDEFKQDKNVSILGFPADSDWVLQGPYSDKSLMRNALSYKWSNDMGQYAVRTRFIEMFLNTSGGDISLADYVGVYVLMEKIKRDRGRVDIATLDPNDNTEPNITGGYIVKKDKFDGGEQTFTTSTGLELIPVEPKEYEITPAQINWIENYLREFESVLFSAGFADPVNGYAAYIDVNSFIDHHILVEMTKNIDGIRLSTYMTKDRGGKLKMGPVWDYNLSLGNADYLGGWQAQGWYYQNAFPSGGGGYQWYSGLFDDPAFVLRYWDRWYAWRRNIFHTESLLQDIDDYTDLLQEAQVRNFERWQILGRRLWPNWFIADTFQEEIDWMKQWLEQRVEWMDEQFLKPPLFQINGADYSGGPIELHDQLSMIAQGSASYIDTELVGEGVAVQAHVPTDSSLGLSWTDLAFVPDATWTDGSTVTGVGYENSGDYNAWISTNLRSQMYGRATSVLCRIEFETNSALVWDRLQLQMKYDDGFVAYLNGTEIARSPNVGSDIPSRASASNHEAGNAYEPFSITQHAPLLLTGRNVLALHGINTSRSSSDMLVLPKLVGQIIDWNTAAATVWYTTDGSDPRLADGTLNPAAQPFDAALILAERTHIKARYLQGNNWSALNEALLDSN